ncbi:uncharacterized protein LY89DRAFT_229246 [Mollisia scopiformis]|uniref:GAF domain-containing protein n=1 Tax=Mollisia scopiformis TaxID=149040 RepID=A0A194WUN9_MOLSC|nr:uncharacterized protein LY89DRAFT_229246 [Mollisia scopiformis]KUJ11665.1 hypothetical protein LY89DRAFT_229246 [Mollisia scopiformis]
MPRAIMSLIDHEHQYVLAEATRSVSLYDPKKTEQGDELWVGSVQLPLKWGICPDTLHTFISGDGSKDKSTDYITANQHCYIINDLASLECFKDKSYVAGPPFLRFYAEVPLKLHGYVVGGFCVVDYKPRAGLDAAALETLVEVASAITEHLGLVIAQDRLKRSREMIQTLAQFARGKQAQDLLNVITRRWTQDPAKAQTMSVHNRTDSERHATESKTESNTFIVPDVSIQVSDYGSAPSESGTDSLTVDSTMSEHGSVYTPTEHGFSTPTADNTFLAGELEMPKSVRSFLSTNASSRRNSGTDELARTAVKLLFNRACHRIRQASDLEGIIFVECSTQDTAMPSKEHTPKSNRSPDSEDDLARETSNTVDCKFRPIVPDTGSQGNSDTDGKGKQSRVCELLGYAFRSEVGGFGPAPLPRHSSLPQSTLRTLRDHYPQGEIFHFDENGSILEFEDGRAKRCGAETDDESRIEFERNKKQLRGYQLLDVCLGARSIIFFPLWDPQKDQWFAGSLAWTNDPARLLDEDDVAMLATFGSCVMAEKAKMDALNADYTTTKAEFISSVSRGLERAPSW